MTKKRVWWLKAINSVLSVVAGTLFLVAPASAQVGSSGFSLGVGGGFARASSMGYYMLSTLEFPSPFRVLRPRADVFFADWGEHVTAVTANVLVTPFSAKSVAPYALAGAGAYSEPGSNPKSGWTLGLGLRLPGQFRSVVIESQMHGYLLGHVPEPGSSRWRYLFKPIGLVLQF